MTTDTSESGLERLICTALTGHACDPVAADGLRERPAAYGAGWLGGSAQDYDREYCVDLAQLSAFREIFIASWSARTSFRPATTNPLLHTMYVDKPLSGVKAVQTLSRLNRAHPGKYDAFVLDFANDVDTIEAAFADYYRTTVLAEETDPNKLHDLQAALDDSQVYSPGQVEELVRHYLSQGGRELLDPILDACVAVYREDLDEDGQIDFKGKAKAFLRTYAFLAAILPYKDADWEKLSIFLTFLVPKLPAPDEDDLSKGILAAIDMDSYRVEKQAVRDIQLADEDAEIGPVPTDGGGHKPEAEMDRLSNILQEFNDLFGNIDWTSRDKIEKAIAEELILQVEGDETYQNAVVKSDKQNARIEHDKTFERAVAGLLADYTELFKQFSDNDSFRRWLLEKSFALTYDRVAAGGRLCGVNCRGQGLGVKG